MISPEAVQQAFQVNLPLGEIFQRGEQLKQAKENLALERQRQSDSDAAKYEESLIKMNDIGTGSPYDAYVNDTLSNATNAVNDYYLKNKGERFSYGKAQQLTAPYLTNLRKNAQIAKASRAQIDKEVGLLATDRNWLDKERLQNDVMKEFYYDKDGNVKRNLNPDDLQSISGRLSSIEGLSKYINQDKFATSLQTEFDKLHPTDFGNTQSDPKYPTLLQYDVPMRKGIERLKKGEIGAELDAEPIMVGKEKMYAMNNNAFESGIAHTDMFKIAMLKKDKELSSNEDYVKLPVEQRAKIASYEVFNSMNNTKRGEARRQETPAYLSTKAAREAKRFADEQDKADKAKGVSKTIEILDASVGGDPAAIAQVKGSDGKIVYSDYMNGEMAKDIDEKKVRLWSDNGKYYKQVYDPNLNKLKEQQDISQKDFLEIYNKNKYNVTNKKLAEPSRTTPPAPTAPIVEEPKSNLAKVATWAKTLGNSVKTVGGTLKSALPFKVKQ